MKKICFLIVLLSCTPALGQNPDSTETNRESHSLHTHLYHINGWLTGSFILGAGVADLFALQTVRFKPAITDAEFDGLNPNTMGAFDRWALRQNTTNYLGIENYATAVNGASVLLPLLLFLDKSIGNDWGTILAMYLEVQSASLALYMISPMGPLFQNKYRPIVYYNNLTRDERKNGNNRNSFYSGHVASVATATFFMTKVYSDYHPELGANKFWLYGFACVPPLILGYIRMIGLNHFPSDILTGLGVGALCGILIPELHRFKSDNLSLGMYSSPESTGLSLNVALK